MSTPTNESDQFYHLNPSAVLRATENAGFFPTGKFLQLNSYENRVFDLTLEDPEQAHIIAKFYRPQRWSKAALLEEHEFLFDLEKEGLTVATPLRQKNGETLSVCENIYVAFFPKVLGRLPQEFINNDLVQVGQKLALLHNVGAQKKFTARPILAESPKTPWQILDELAEFISLEIRSRYLEVASELFTLLSEEIDPDSFQRIHGDCHRGNLLQNSLGEYFFVDFDDTMMGPVMHDFWMLFSSDNPKELSSEQELIISGYEKLRSFPYEQLRWISLLRGYRIIHYASWISRRWKDPSFPKLFPQFTQYNYWAEEVEALEKILWSFHKTSS